MKQKLRLMGALVALATLALAVSCRGFFVNPTLTGVSVGPQGLTLNVNETWQMGATGTYSDGSQKTLTSGVTWSSSDGNTVSVGKTSGIVTGAQIGSASITAAAGSCSACSGSTTVTVVLTGITSITVSPSSASAKVNQTSGYFTATAQPGSVDITNSGAVWKVQDSTGTDQTANFTLSFLAGSGEGFLPLTGATLPSYTVVASYPGSNFVGKATLFVTQSQWRRPGFTSKFDQAAPLLTLWSILNFFIPAPAPSPHSRPGAGLRPARKNRARNGAPGEPTATRDGVLQRHGNV